MKKSLYILAALPLLMLSCAKEQQYTPGAPDDANCLGVFFPTQEEVSGAHAFDPVEPTTFKVAVVRKTKAGAVTVPCEVTDTAKIFSVSEITFEDGKDTTFIEVNFPEAQIGVPYALDLKISGDQYVSKYSSTSPYFSCVITREKWVEIGECEFYDDFFGYDPIKVKIEQNDGNKKQFRLVDPYIQYADLLIADGCGFDPSAADKYLKFELVPKGGTIGGVKITLDNLVDMTSYSTGIDPGYGNVTLYHAKTFSSLSSEENFAINKVVAYQEDGTPADVQLAPIYYDPDGAWNDGTEVMITILFPGCVRTDYSIEMASYEPEGGKAIVEYTLGPDVAYAATMFCEGELTGGEISAKVSAISKGNVAETDTVHVAESGFYEFELPKDTVYTAVAVTFDENDAACENASVVVYYTKEVGDVVFNAEASLSNKYASQGYTKKNSFVYWMNGEDIRNVWGGVFKKADFDINPDAIYEALYHNDDYAFDPAVIDEINEGVAEEIASDLSEGGEYVLVLSVSNGYSLLNLNFPVTLEGTYVPTATTDNTTVDKFFINQPEFEDYAGKYNFYYTDGLEGEPGVRVKAANTVTLSVGDEGIINASGLFAPIATQYEYTDCVAFEYYEGYLYNTFNYEYEYLDAPEGVDRCVELYAWSDDYGPLDVQGIYVGGLVDDGAIAFCDCSFADPDWAQYEFATNGLSTVICDYFVNPQTGEDDYEDVDMSVVTDIVLYDVTKDKTPEPKSIAAGAVLQKTGLAYVKKAFSRPDCMVLNERGQIRHAIDRVNIARRNGTLVDMTAPTAFEKSDYKVVTITKAMKKYEWLKAHRK